VRLTRKKYADDPRLSKHFIEKKRGDYLTKKRGEAQGLTGENSEGARGWCDDDQPQGGNGF
jgi:hypothetical protein